MDTLLYEYRLASDINNKCFLNAIDKYKYQRQELKYLIESENIDDDTEWTVYNEAKTEVLTSLKLFLSKIVENIETLVAKLASKILISISSHRLLESLDAYKKMVVKSQIKGDAKVEFFNATQCHINLRAFLRDTLNQIQNLYDRKGKNTDSIMKIFEDITNDTITKYHLDDLDYFVKNLPLLAAIDSTKDMVKYLKNIQRLSVEDGKYIEKTIKSCTEKNPTPEILRTYNSIASGISSAYCGYLTDMLRLTNGQVSYIYRVINDAITSNSNTK